MPRERAAPRAVDKDERVESDKNIEKRDAQNHGTRQRDTSQNDNRIRHAHMQKRNREGSATLRCSGIQDG